jgi:hemerythrin-like domain-containing protein
MNSLLGAPVAPAFDDPLEMLFACHGRITAQCDTLRRLVEHISTHCNDVQASQAARAILRYFDTAGQHHHQDEEQDLFPTLLATHDQTAAALVARLLGEHKIIEAAWQRLRPFLLDIAENGSAPLDAETATRFIDVYAKHIILENGELLPLAKILLSPSQLQTLGHNMAARRGVTV